MNKRRMIKSRQGRKLTSVILLLTLAAICYAQDRISATDFKNGIDSGRFDLIVDVRTEQEWKTGRIPGAVHVPLNSLEEFWKQTNPGFSCDGQCARIVVYCAVGGRAAKAIETIRDIGFKGTLYNGGGTSQWVAAGYSLLTDDDLNQNLPDCFSIDICEKHNHSVTESNETVTTPTVKEDKTSEQYPAISDNVSSATTMKSSIVQFVPFGICLMFLL